MKLADALIAWSPATSRVRIGPAPQPSGVDWTVWPAAYARKRRGSEVADIQALMTEIVTDGVPPAAVHRAFLLVDEYRDLEGE